MNEYEIVFVYELVNIRTIAIADNKKQAIRYAEMNLANTGIILHEDASEILITKTGEYK